MDEIKVPDLGGFDQVEVIEVSVSVGDSVDVDDAIIVVETDKATMEIPSPSAGVIQSLSVKEGDKVSEGDVVAMLEGASNVSSDGVSESDGASESDDAAASESSPVEAVASETQAESQTNGEPQNQEVLVPDLGGFSDVEVIEVSVEAGQQLSEEETLVVVETDKATMEIPAPWEGELVEIFVKAGERVSEGDRIAVIKTAGAVASDAGGAKTGGSEVSGSKVSGAEVPQSHAQASPPSGSDQEKVKVQNNSADSSLYKANSEAGDVKPSGKVYAGPAVRKLAREFGVSLDEVLSAIGASGPRGRVLQEDIQSYVKKRLNEPAVTQSTGTASGQGIEPIPEIDFSRFGSVREEALSRIQKISSQHLHRCWLNVPHVTQFDEIDITELESFRKSVNQEGSYTIKLTLIPFLVKAVQKVLAEMPRFNASLAADGETLIVKEYYNIGVAVDTEQGLMVPVVKGVDTKSVTDIAADCIQYATQARDGKLLPDALQGSCFSISSLGGIGGTQFTPIVNAPEVAILGVSKASIKPVWQDDGWQPRLILPVALSYDHRVVDGVLAAKFTTRLKTLLEDSRHMLL